MNNYIWYDVLYLAPLSCYEIRGRLLRKDGMEEEETAIIPKETEFDTILRILDILQQYQVSLLHMEDVICDFLKAFKGTSISS